MKITEFTFGKTIKKTKAIRQKGDKTLVDYYSIEPSISLTISDPTETEITEVRDRINKMIENEENTEPTWLKEDTWNKVDDAKAKTGYNYFKKKV